MTENKKIVVYVDLDNTITDFKSGVESFPADVQAQYGMDESSHTIKTCSEATISSMTTRRMAYLSSKAPTSILDRVSSRTGLPSLNTSKSYCSRNY